MTGHARGHRLLPHTADIVLEAWGPDVGSCCAEAVAALVETYTDAAGATVVDSRRLGLAPAPPTELLLEVLEEVIFLLDTADAVPVGATIGDVAGGGLDVVVHLAAADTVEPAGAAPKAVSRSELRFDVDRDGARCSVLVDV